MSDKNNELVVVTKSIFDKIKNFFKNIFSKKRIENDSYDSSNEKIETEHIVEIEDSQDKEKKEFFRKYKAYKEGKLKSSDFTGSEKVKLNSMLNEEFNLSKNKFEKVIKEYNEK